MNRLIPKLVSRIRVVTEETIDFQFWAIELDMLNDSFYCFYILIACETLYLITLTFVFKMLLNVLHKNILLDLIVEASMLDLYFTKHVLE